MKLRYVLLLSTLLLGGCIANMGLGTMAESENNTYNLWRIDKGMSQGRVLQIMHKPFDYETFQLDEDIYDVWFYITRVTALGQSRLVPQNLTPLTFKNGVLIDVGYVYYNYLVKEEAIRAKAAAVPTPQEASPTQPREPLENPDLEKALEAPPGTPVEPSSVKPITPPQETAPNKTAPTPPAAPAKPKNTKPSPKTPTTNKTPNQGTVPQNQLPGRAPQNAPAPSSSQKTSQLSMCTKPRISEAASKKDSSSEEEKNESPDGYQWDEEDQRMQEQESEQNFDYW